MPCAGLGMSRPETQGPSSFPQASLASAEPEQLALEAGLGHSQEKVAFGFSSLCLLSRPPTLPFQSFSTWAHRNPEPACYWDPHPEATTASQDAYHLPPSAIQTQPSLAFSRNSSPWIELEGLILTFQALLH